MIRSSCAHPADEGKYAIASTVMSWPMMAKSPPSSSRMSGHPDELDDCLPPSCGSGPILRRIFILGMGRSVLKTEHSFRIPNIVLNSERAQMISHIILTGLNSKGAKNIVGAQIARYRASLSLSQSDFAGLCQRSGWDISRETLAKIESGIRCVTDIELLEISAALKLPIPTLFPARKQHFFKGASNN